MNITFQQKNKVDKIGVKVNTKEKRLEIELETKIRVIQTLLNKNMQLTKELEIEKEKNRDMLLSSGNNIKPLIEIIPDINFERDISENNLNIDSKNKDGFKKFEIYIKYINKCEKLNEMYISEYDIIVEKVDELKKQYEKKVRNESHFGSIYLNPSEYILPEGLKEIIDEIIFLEREKIILSERVINLLLDMRREGYRLIGLSGEAKKKILNL